MQFKGELFPSIFATGASLHDIDRRLAQCIAVDRLLLPGPVVEVSETFIFLRFRRRFLYV